jgi:hypothetical protein
MTQTTQKVKVAKVTIMAVSVGCPCGNTVTANLLGGNVETQLLTELEYGRLAQHETFTCGHCGTVLRLPKTKFF